MPGITGIAAAEASATLERMERALFRAPLLARQRMDANGLACTLVSASDSSGVLARDGVRLAFEGFLYDEARRGRAVLEGLLDRFLERGDGFAEGLNGNFQMVVQAGGITRVYVDHLASRRLFYRQGPGFLAFSPEIAPLAELAPARLDEANLVQFLANGRFFAGGSLLESIAQVLPGEHLVWDGRTLARQRGYRHRLAPTASFEPAEAMARLQTELQSAILQRWERADRPAILLTGGYDSRYIFNTIVEHVADASTLRTVTWGERLDLPGSDAEIADRIARRFKLRHLVLERRLDRIPECFEDMFDAQSGMTEYTLLHADELAICRELAEVHGIRSLFRGDECFGITGPGAATVQEALGQLSLRRAAEIPGAERWLEGGAAALEAQSAHLARRVAACPPMPNDLRDTLYFEERLPASPHHLGYYKSHYQEMFNPLLDLRVLRVAATFPEAWRIDKSLFKACFHQRFARHLDIPFADKSNGIDWSRALPRAPNVVALLRASLESLPAPLNRSFFLEQLSQALAAPPSAPRAPGAVPPEQLAIRACVLGRWLQRWPPA